MAKAASRAVRVCGVSSAARIPLPFATIARAISSSVAVMVRLPRGPEADPGALWEGKASTPASNQQGRRQSAPEPIVGGSPHRAGRPRPGAAPTYLVRRGMTVLAGDIGGTNSRLALYDAAPTATDRPVFDRSYPSG